jgi:8-oxo-dGTP pyrophosphatase MutT (NUDIX family)
MLPQKSQNLNCLKKTINDKLKENNDKLKENNDTDTNANQNNFIHEIVKSVIEKVDTQKITEEVVADNAVLSSSPESDHFVFLNDEEVLVYNPRKKSPNKSKYRNIYCVNCGEKGHVVKDCHGPITSFGIIAFKVVDNNTNQIHDKNSKLVNILSSVKQINTTNTYPKTKFLMIQRKDTMGFTDFVRGKYPDDQLESKKILPIFLNEMTEQEKQSLLTKSFDEIWRTLWVNHDSKCFKNEYEYAYRKFQKLDIPNLIQEFGKSNFTFQEFGFPKGRRNMKETNIACAEREFFEETGYDKNCYDFIKNYPTIHEEFVGTNGVRYRHIYYLVKIKDDAPPAKIDYKNKIQTGEVQNIGWFTYDECMSVIRPYDIAKKQVIKKVYDDLLVMKDNYVCSNFYYTGKKQYKSSTRNINIPIKQYYSSFNYGHKSL